MMPMAKHREGRPIKDSDRLMGVEIAHHDLPKKAVAHLVIHRSLCPSTPYIERLSGGSLEVICFDPQAPQRITEKLYARPGVDLVECLVEQKLSDHSNTLKP
jgi:hypothetical protein